MELDDMVILILVW